MIQLRDLPERWRAEATLLERHGAPDQAAALRTSAAELEEHILAWENEPLSIPQSKDESDYSEAQLRRQFPGQKTIRRQDLPRKPGRRDRDPDLAARILTSNSTVTHHSGSL